MAKQDKLQLSKTETVIAAGTSISGGLQSTGGLRIEGHMSGDIKCEGDVIIGTKAVTHSNITARNVFVGGEVRGDITCNGTLAILPKGRIYGDMFCTKLVVEEGGMFEGQNRMVKPKSGQSFDPKTEGKSETAMSR